MKTAVNLLKVGVLVALVASLQQVGSAREDPPPTDSQQQGAWQKRNRDFTLLYLSRFEKNVTLDILPFALAETDYDPEHNLQARAIIALGRIEDEQAEEPLQKLEEHMAKSEGDPKYMEVNWLLLRRLKLALARIHFRDLKGQAKLDALTQSIDLTWTQVQDYGDRLKAASADNSKSYMLQESYELEIVKEFIDVLRSMERSGEKLDGLGTERLVYTPLIAPLLSTGEMTREQEADYWLKRSSAPTQYVFDPAVLAGLGNSVKPILLKHLNQELEKLQQEPELFQRQDLSTLALDRAFEAAAAMDDAQFVPVLKKFAQSSNLKIKEQAKQWLQPLEQGGALDILPRRYYLLSKP